MLTWQTIEDLPGRTPVPLDLALEALQPENPRALLLRLYGGGHLLEELPPDAIMRAAKDYFAAIGEATNQFDKRLAPVETMTTYLSDPSTWARLHILREELLALRPAPKLETSPAGQARKIVLPVPGTKETAARAPEKITLTGSAAEALAEMEKRTMAEAIAEMERSVSGSAAKALAEAVAWEKNIIRPIFPPLNVLFPPRAPAPPAAPDHQEAGPKLIGSTFVYTWKGIAAELNRSVDTAKRYAKRGLVVVTEPRIATTKEEIARWSKTPDGRRLKKK